MTLGLCIRSLKIHFILTLLSLAAFSSHLAFSQTVPPHIFYSDIESGPNTGGENNAGAYVTVYGKNFGASRGSSFVSVGNGAASAYPVWTDTKIAFQLGAAAQSGNIVVTTAGGASNAVPFTVRAGRIVFVSTSGNDSNSGTFASPWKTILKGRDSSTPGDIIYAMNGVSQTTDDGTGWSAAITFGASDCSPSNPRALVAYPGATVTVGTISGPTNAIRASNPSVRGGLCTGGWVLAGMSLRGVNASLILEGLSAGWRVVGNDMTCPNGDGASACVETSIATNIKFYGNNVHDTGKVGASALYHGVYFSTDTNHVDMGWNIVANVHGCRGIQVHSSPLQGGGSGDPTGHNQFDMIFHDNIIHDTQCDGIILATVDPSQGKVEVYNNIIYNAGKGPNNPEGSGNWACVYAPGYTNTGAPGGGTVEVYNNTLSSCGTFASPPYQGSNGGVMNGGHNANLKVRMRNNIINNTSGIPYWIADDSGGENCGTTSACNGVIGSNNLFFGNGTAPATPNITAPVNANPLFVNPGQFDFHIAAGSPAATAGVATSLLFDFDGVALPQGSTYPIGAYAFRTGLAPVVSVSINPLTASLTGGQGQQFTATAGGATNTDMNWSMSPSVGTLSATGMYTAPGTVATTQNVTVTAALKTDTSKIATAVVTLTASAPAPPPTAPVTGNGTGKIGIFRAGFFWIEDMDGNHQFSSSLDRAFAFGGIAGDIPLSGDWNGSGTSKVGVYRPANGLFILDYNGDGLFTAADKVYKLGVGVDPTDKPVVGDWNGDGKTKVGLFRQGFFWILDYNGNGVYDETLDRVYDFGHVAGDIPVVGDWTGSGTSKIGVFRAGFYWVLDANGNGSIDQLNAAGGDQAFAFGGFPGDVPVVGDWNGNGVSKVGVFRLGFFWVLDANGNHTFDGTGTGQDLAFPFGGVIGDKPVVGKW